MLHYIPKELSVPEVHKLLLGGVGPRPIALVSTISKDGINNLSPFSFFNAFGANPPVIAFSPARRGRDGSLKDTYNNLVATKECVVQSVTYSIVEQISLASTEYPSEVDEFVKSGLTPVNSDLVKPRRVKESPFQMECELIEMKSIGERGGSANLAICEVVKFHVDENIFSGNIIDPIKIDLVGRMSGDFYSRASAGVFEVEKPVSRQGIGYDQLPDFIKSSRIYSGNNLGKFGNSESIPSNFEVSDFVEKILKENLADSEVSEEKFNKFQNDSDYKKMFIVALKLEQKGNKRVKEFIELSAKSALEQGDDDFAWKAAIYAGKY